MKKILIAEDNDSNYLLMTYILKNRYEYVRAFHGEEAVEKAADPTIDMVLMDIRMPIMDGLEATKKIKATRPDLPIVALTANAFDRDRERSLEAGCDDFLAKPVSYDTCLKMIEKFLLDDNH